MKRAVCNILFITWDGPDTRYLERLFLPIFDALRAYGFNFHVLQFTWDTAETSRQRHGMCQDLAIPYRRAPVMRSFGSAGPFLSALSGARLIRRAIKDWDIDTLMPRSLMPALAAMMLRKSERQSLNVVFDADGLAIDERVDFGGISPHGLTYRILRDIEAEFLRSSDIVLTRTEAAKSVLLARAGSALLPSACHVISNGVDSSPFKEAIANHKEDENRSFTLCYCGSMGAQYRVLEMMDIAIKLKKVIPLLRFHLFTSGTEVVARALREKSLQHADWIQYGPISAQSVPEALVRCDLGIALRQQSFSTQAILPIKLGEYLLAGLPVIGTPGVGSTTELESAGVFRSGEVESLDETIKWVCLHLLPKSAEMKQICHEVGLQYFSVEQTAERYAAALTFDGHFRSKPGVS